MLTFLCYPRCTTCKKAEAWLKENNVDYVLRDIKEEKPTFEELKAWFEKSSEPLKKFFNTSGLLYKELKLMNNMVLVLLVKK